MVLSVSVLIISVRFSVLGSRLILPKATSWGFETEEGSCGVAKHAAEGAGRGRDGPPGLVLGPGPLLLRWTVAAGALLVGPTWAVRVAN